MSLNKQSGNMYGFITHTWNPIKGRCSYDCKYCSIKSIYKRYKKEMKQIYIDEKELEIKLGKDNKIFVGSSIDLFAEDVPSNWIERTIDYCNRYDNLYLYHTKNPERMIEYIDRMLGNIILCVTLESDSYSDSLYPDGKLFKHSTISNAPSFWNRIHTLRWLRDHLIDIPFMITIEPILKFTDSFASILIDINPYQINIGADSKGHGLPEPNKEKIIELINQLELAGLTVYQKSNLARLLK